MGTPSRSCERAANRMAVITERCDSKSRGARGRGRLCTIATTGTYCFTIFTIASVPFTFSTRTFTLSPSLMSLNIAVSFAM